MLMTFTPGVFAAWITASARLLTSPALSGCSSCLPLPCWPGCVSPDADCPPVFPLPGGICEPGEDVPDPAGAPVDDPGGGTDADEVSVSSL